MTDTQTIVEEHQAACARFAAARCEQVALGPPVGADPVRPLPGDCQRRVGLPAVDSRRGFASANGESASDHGGDVRVTGPRCICLRPDCPLCRKLQVATVQAAQITAPVATVTGVVAASLRPGNGKGNDYWQFNSPELLTAFTDWEKATADIAFAETQLAAIKQLADTKVDAQQKLVERMKKLVAAGTDTEKDLAAAQADLIQSQIQGRKDVHEARRRRGWPNGRRPRRHGNFNRAVWTPICSVPRLGMSILSWRTCRRE